MSKKWHKTHWPTVIYLVLLHLGALTAPFCFSWSAFSVFVAMAVTTGLSVTLGFHRLLTHRSFETYRVVRWLLAFTGGLAGEGGAIKWVADHRAHHKFTDRDGDPHSPRDGFWWAHTLWTLPWRSNDRMLHHYRFYCPDLCADGVIYFIDRTFIVWHFLTAGLFFWLGGWSWLAWGVFLRLVVVLHTTWMVNSVTHKFGYRNYATDDDSTNLWWLTIFTFGEANHNNHHAYPTAANHGHRWFEFDATYRVIRLLERLGLVWNVKRHEI